MKLADVNVLVALSHSGHPHHARAVTWREKNKLTTCPLTELGLVRVLMQLGLPAADAFTQLATVRKEADFIPCDASAGILSGKVSSHRQTTDVYLVELAKRHNLSFCTFDEGIKGAEYVS